MKLASFSGTWRLDRQIEDGDGRGIGVLSGEARFLPGDAGTAYVETGMLRMQGAVPVAAGRRLAWRAGMGRLIDVYFDDGRWFHSFDPGAPEPTGAHDCPPDRYEVMYDFACWPEWSSCWRVQGPRKDYRIVSRYRPAGQVGGIGA